MLFTSYSGTSPGSWSGVYVYGSNNSFRHCTFEYGNWALRLQGPASGNTVEYCTFRNNYAGLYIRDNNAEVKSCRIHNNQSYGVYCYSNPEVKFQGNRIYDNLFYILFSDYLLPVI
ncbi:MAG TPA: hypothetical protein DHW42_08285 [Candidatus Marinimicrobia bacterium]|nr:hypothetical protein [Candidatus Neomarinimicrobiota bacterium]